MSAKAVDSTNKSNEDGQKAEQQQYNENIINQLIELEIGSRSQIIQAMEMVNDKNNVEEIAEYLMTTIDNKCNQNTNIQHNKTTENNDKVTLLMSMGYDINSVKKALEISNNDTQIAAQYLIDGVININTYNYEPKQYTQPIPKKKVSKPKLKPIEFENVNDKTKIYSGALIQIVSSNHKDSISQFWDESNINGYDIDLRGLVGIIKSIQPNNQTITMQTSEQKEIVVPIKACMSIKYDKLTDKKDTLLVCGYMRCMDVSKDIPPLVNKLCYEYYHIVDLRLSCDDSKENDLLITRNACKLSIYLNSINILCENKISKIYICDVPYHILKMVVEWLSYHNGIEPKALPIPITSNIMKEICGDVWDADYIDSKDKKTIFEIILVSNQLKIKGLLHLGSAKIASLIKQMDQTEINRIIQEEEIYRRQHANNT